jgi:hypothetical protein
MKDDLAVFAGAQILFRGPIEACREFVRSTSLCNWVIAEFAGGTIGWAVVDVAP